MRPRLVALLGFVAASIVRCSAPPPAFERASGRPFTAAEDAFHADPRWLGADAALSIPLDGERTLWLFGDTFVATTDARVRTESTMVRNSVALQRGPELRRDAMEFAWREDAPVKPSSFFAEPGDGRWFWPGHGLRPLGAGKGPLVVFLFALRRDEGPELGFASAGFALAVVDDPDAPLHAWRPRIVEAAAPPFDALPATAVVADGDHVVALAIRQRGAHAGTLVRYAASALARGELEDARWWCGPDRGWVAPSNVGAGGPCFVIDDAGAECSLHFDERTRSFVHVASYGFGASTIGVRTAAALTGPWSEPVEVYRPPESDALRPFVYAAKAHPELRGPARNDLVVTYATNSFEFSDVVLSTGASARYWPRCVAVRLRD